MLVNAVLRPAARVGFGLAGDSAVWFDSCMAEVDLVIDVRDGDDSDLMDFLKTQGVRVRPHYGIYNGPMPDMSEMLKHPAPYVWATATATVLTAAINAYARSRNRKLVISRLKTGTKIEATNYTAEEIKDLGVLDIGRFEPSDTKPQK
ncbi:MAG TPA: hypothetical protein VH597_15115 [Verrucomicrobiae bacterium]|jgi:hypothetical protein|nr:hypothetical protein [Verrucomicrobiae bacterium]